MELAGVSVAMDAGAGCNVEGKLRVESQRDSEGGQRRRLNGCERHCEERGGQEHAGSVRARLVMR